MAVPELKVKVTADAAGVNRELGSMADGVEEVENSVSSASRAIKSFVAAAVSIGAIAGIVKGVASEAEKFETSMLRINAIIKATGGAAGRTGEQLLEFARSLALNTLESTEGVLEAQQRLLTFRKISGDVFDRTIAAAADMAAAMGGDISGAAIQLGKALEDPVTGMTALTRSGTVFTEAQKDMVKSLVESGNLMEAQRFILSELEAQYGGTAQAAAQGYAGALDTLAQRLQEMRLAMNESFGITDTLTMAVNGLARVVEVVTENMDRLASYAMAAAIAGAVALRGVFIAGAAAVWGMVGSLAALRTALIRTGIGAVVVAAGELIFQFRRLSEAAGGMGEALSLVSELASQVFQRIGAFALVGVLRIVAAFYDFQDSAREIFHTVMQYGVDAANGLISKMAGAAAAIGAVFKAIPRAISSAVASAINFVLQKIETLIQNAIGGVNTLIEGLNSIPGVDLGQISFSGLGRVEGDAAGAGESIGDAFSRGASGAFQIPDLAAPVSDGTGAELSGMADILANAASAPLPALEKIRDLLGGMKEDGITLPDILGVGDTEGGESDGAGGGGSGGGGGGASAATKKLDEELTAQENRIKTHFDRVKALTMGGLSDKLGAWGSYFSNLASLTQSNNRKLLAIAKAAQAAQALMDAWSAYAATLKDPAFVGRPFARVAAAGQVLAAGLGAVNAIKGISASGTSSGSSGGGGGGASVAATAGRADTLDATIRIESAGGLSSEATQEIASLVVEQFRDRGLTSAQVFG